MLSNRNLKSLANNVILGYQNTLAISYLIYIILNYIFSFNMYICLFIRPIFMIGFYSHIFKLRQYNDIKVKNIITNFNMIKKSIFTTLLIITLTSFLTFFISIISKITIHQITLIFTNLNYNIMTKYMNIILLIINIYLFSILESLNYSILNDNQDINPIESIKYSIKLMKNNKLKIVSLDISFITSILLILAISKLTILSNISILITLLYVWIIPYYIATKIELYHELKENYILEK